MLNDEPNEKSVLERFALALILSCNIGIAIQCLNAEALSTSVRTFVSMQTQTAIVIHGHERTRDPLLRSVIDNFLAAGHESNGLWIEDHKKRSTTKPDYPKAP